MNSLSTNWNGIQVNWPFIWIPATAQIKEFSLIMTKLQQSCTHGDMSIDLALADVVQLSVSPDFVQEEHEVLA